MTRTVLLVLALLDIIVIALVWTGVIGLQSTPDGGVAVTANRVEVKMETRQVNVQVPVVSTNSAPSQ